MRTVVHIICHDQFSKMSSCRLMILSNPMVIINIKKAMPRLKVAIILLLVGSAVCASTPAIWAGSNLYQTGIFTIYSGITTVITSTATKSVLVTTTFMTTFSSLPKAVGGVNKLISNPGDYLDFSFLLQSITTTKLSINAVIGVNTTVQMLSVYYMAINPTVTSLMSNVNVNFTSTTNSTNILIFSDFCKSGFRNA